MYRSKTAPMAIPHGKDVGRSFKECTTRSTEPFSNASSKSLVNNDFSPILGNDMFSTLSPKVDMVTVKRKSNK